MEYDIKSVVEKYIQLRDQKAELAKKHQEELRPLSESMEVIEKVLLQEMDKMGVDSLKTPFGTPYKSVTKSVKMTDPDAYKQYIFLPLIESLSSYITSIGGQVPDFRSLFTMGPKWDMVDFRPLKKGVVEHTEETGELPPGVTMDSFTTLNIRRA